MAACESATDTATPASVAVFVVLVFVSTAGLPARHLFTLLKDLSSVTPGKPYVQVSSGTITDEPSKADEYGQDWRVKKEVS